MEEGMAARVDRSRMKRLMEGTLGASCWRWKTRAEWVINQVTHRTKDVPSPKGMLAPLSPGKAEDDTDPKESCSSGSGQGQDPMCLCMGWAQRGSLCPSTNTLKVASEVAVKMLGLRQGREGEKEQ